MTRDAARRLQVSLPYGLSDARGRRHRSALLRPLSGSGELAATEESNPFRAASLVLADCLLRLGPYSDLEIDESLVHRLFPLDVAFLLVQLQRLTFGDIQYQVVRCPSEACGERLDVRLDLSTVSPGRLPDGPHGSFTLEDGRRVLFRCPLTSDQIALHGLPTDGLEEEFLRRQILSPDSSPAQPGLLEVLALSAETRSRLVQDIVASSPDLDLVLELTCLRCQETFRFVYDPIRTLLSSLHSRRRALLREVHTLAFYYHWSQRDILELSHSLRREFLSLLEDELSRTRGGGLSP